MKSKRIDTQLRAWNEDSVGVQPPPEVYREFRDTGCQLARKRILEGILPMVKQIARRYERHASIVGQLEIDDLIQEGLIGALNAAKLFNPDLGFKFTTYAHGAIVNRIRGAIARSDFVSSKARKEGNKQTIVSYDRKTSNDIDKPIRGMLQAKKSREKPTYSMDEMLAMIHDDREREVIRMRFVEEKTLDEIGRKFDVTRERIRQLESRALESMRLGMTLNARYPKRRLTEEQ